MRQIIIAIVASVFAAIYWFFVFLYVHADILFAGDRAPYASPPPESELFTRAGIALTVGIAGFAALIWISRRLIRAR